MTDDEIVEAMNEAWGDAYEAEYFTYGGFKDNRKTAMNAAFAAARQAIRDQALDEAAAKYDEFHKWVCDQISTATYNAEELEQGLVGWQPLADTMFNGTMASWESAILALKGTPHAQD